jgi:hypothetical protein
VIEEAIASCPVDCIHPVALNELQQLEQERVDDVIKYNNLFPQTL